MIFSVMFQPALCRSHLHLFARPAVFLLDIFADVTFVPRAPSQATARRQVPGSDGIYVNVYFTFLAIAGFFISTNTFAILFWNLER